MTARAGDAIDHQEMVRRCLASPHSRMTYRERQVLRVRYGEWRTLEDAARALGVTVGRIRSIEKKALLKFVEFSQREHKGLPKPRRSSK
jgi:DNA-directed RNA polymerase sigma subunit (sigma70/sigma32)